MSGEQSIKSPMLFEVFEKALIKAMLKSRRVFVTREEVMGCLPNNVPSSGAGRVDISSYLYGIYEWGTPLGLVTFPELIQYLNESERNVFQHLLDSLVMDIDLDVYNRLVIEYLNYTRFVHHEYWVHFLFTKARQYFVIKDLQDERDPNFNRREVFDGGELVASIRYYRESGEYFFYRISASGEDLDASH